MDSVSAFSCEKEKTLLFYVGRSFDRQVVAYRAVRTVVGQLEPPFVEMYWTSIDSLHTVRDNVSEKTKELFFGFKIIRKGSQYKMCINALEEKNITLHLKKSGRVTAKAIIAGKEATICKIYVMFQKPQSSLGIIPTAISIDIYGIHRGAEVTESIPITDEMRSRFDVRSFLPKFNSLFS